MTAAAVQSCGDFAAKLHDLSTCSSALPATREHSRAFSAPCSVRRITGRRPSTAPKHVSMAALEIRAYSQISLGPSLGFGVSAPGSVPMLAVGVEVGADVGAEADVGAGAAVDVGAGVGADVGRGTQSRFRGSLCVGLACVVARVGPPSGPAIGVGSGGSASGVGVRSAGGAGPSPSVGVGSAPGSIIGSASGRTGIASPTGCRSSHVGGRPGGGHGGLGKATWMESPRSDGGHDRQG